RSCTLGADKPTRRDSSAYDARAFSRNALISCRSTSSTSPLLCSSVAPRAPPLFPGRPDTAVPLGTTPPFARRPDTAALLGTLTMPERAGLVAAGPRPSRRTSLAIPAATVGTQGISLAHSRPEPYNRREHARDSPMKRG